MNLSDLTEEQRLQRASLAVMIHTKYRSLGGVIMMGATSVEDDPGVCPTAYTDGYNVRYGRAFMSGLKDPEMRFLVLHEAMHKGLLHLTTWQWMWKENPARANEACDHVINLMLLASDAGEGFISMPEGGVADPRFAGMDAGEVYRLLKSEGDKNSNGYKGFDEHGWGQAQSCHANGQEGLTKEVGQALQQGTVLVGNMSGDIDRAVREMLEPKIDWRAALRDFVSSICSGKDFSSWRRPRRRTIDSGIYLPSYYSETVGRVCIGVDTSGSVDGDLLAQFLAEVAGIASTLRPELVDLLYWDVKVKAHEKYAEGQYDMLLQSTKPKGGGGTSPSCVTAYLAANHIKPECVVMLSDGAVGSDWGGAWPCPVLWCVTNKRVTAATGRTLYLGE